MTAAELIVRCFRILLPLLSAAITAQLLLSYLPDAGRFAGFLDALTEPILLPFRRLWDALGVTRYVGIDLSYAAAVSMLMILAHYCAYLLC